jgi:hypothetical protein
MERKMILMAAKMQWVAGAGGAPKQAVEERLEPAAVAGAVEAVVAH